MKTQINLLMPGRLMAFILISASLVLLKPEPANAFCGFYVAKADATLFNKTSQVILVRNGDRTTITMSSDFEGQVQDFAMVVPVPVVLKRTDIRTVSSSLFTTLDTYSSPRLVEYYDNNPCETYRMLDEVASVKMNAAAGAPEDDRAERSKDYRVKIEAQYTVDEYDILILSAEESNGLELWLTDNGYKIPAGAKEVLEPYINSNMKFFVVKVNMEELEKKGTEFLSPLQITFNSPKFMLPIRLGMANAKGSQDMIIYAFSRRGRIEATNYRTVKVPTGNLIPEFIQPWFGTFYVDTYRKHRKEAGQNNVYLEYAWNVGSNIGVKCDPCNGPPLMVNDMLTAGVNWLDPNWGQGDVFFTRLHVTYDRKNFPQDLFFEETPNRENFQARYVITHPAYGDFTCAEGTAYVKQVMERRNEELNNLAILTGWDVSPYRDYLSRFAPYTSETGPRQKISKPPVKDQGKRPQSTPAGDGQSSIDTNKVTQASFASPFTSDDDHNNNGSDPMTLMAYGTMLLAFMLTVIASRTRKKKVMS
jgi:hypothetical protein